MKKTVIIIQARMGSSRLPGKVMAQIEGKPMLWHIHQRVKRCRNIDDIIIATTTLPSDDIIGQFCESEDIRYFRGSENDVLGRFYNAATGADVITRITADCPLICPEMIDDHIKIYLEGGYDCVCPRSREGLIRGLDNETFSFDSLERAERESTSEEEREHVTLHFYNNPAKYRIFSPQVEEIYKENVRLCVDEESDLALIRAVYSRLYKDGGIIDAKEAIALIKKEPDLAKINIGVKQLVFDNEDRK